jgi:CBS domain-containing membrane protein
MVTVTVRDLMSEKPVVARPDDSLALLHDLMVQARIRHLPVVDDNNRLVGLVTHRDLLRHALIEQPDVTPWVQRVLRDNLKVSDLMIEEVVTIGPDEDVRVAADTLFDAKIGCLPVVEEGKLVGILTESDFVRFMGSGD